MPCSSPFSLRSILHRPLRLSVQFWLMLPPSSCNCTLSLQSTFLTPISLSASGILGSLAFSVALWLVHTANTDRTRLSCLVLSVFAVWTEVVTRQDCLRLNVSKQLCPTVSKCGVNWVLSCPDPVSNSHATWLPIVTLFGNWVKTSSQMRSHRRQGKTWNCLRLSRTQFTPQTRQDKTVFSCRCSRCELAITMVLTWQCCHRFFITCVQDKSFLFYSSQFLYYTFSWSVFSSCC